MISQIDHRHRADTRAFHRVVEQRNALLRALRDDEGSGDELAFWDDELCRLSAAISLRRLRAVADLGAPFSEASALLAGADGCEVAYLAQVEGDDVDGRADSYRGLLVEKRDRELWQGATLVGPHREDLAVTAAGRTLPSFASRGEQRSAVLALKLAEADWLRERKGDAPVFLLDDVLSELDPARRDAFVAALPDDAQALVTSALPVGLPSRLLERAAIVRLGE
jgi:DNA replication and repair protein RecF